MFVFIGPVNDNIVGAEIDPEIKDTIDYERLDAQLISFTTSNS